MSFIRHITGDNYGGGNDQKIQSTKEKVSSIIQNNKMTELVSEIGTKMTEHGERTKKQFKNLQEAKEGLDRLSVSDEGESPLWSFPFLIPGFGVTVPPALWITLWFGIAFYILYVTGFSDEEIEENTQDKKANMGGIILSALIGPLIFGFLDNFGMMLGVDAIEDKLPDRFKCDPHISAMLGNTFSDGLGALMGNSIASMILSTTAYKDSDVPHAWRPILELVGIVIGCLIPVAFKFSGLSFLGTKFRFSEDKCQDGNELKQCKFSDEKCGDNWKRISGNWMMSGISIVFIILFISLLIYMMIEHFNKDAFDIFKTNEEEEDEVDEDEEILVDPINITL